MRQRFGDKIALEAMVASAKLLVLMTDVHGYTGERYVAFARAHCNINNETDAYGLYILGYGTNGDDVLARCEAESRWRSNYEWPSWRQEARKLRRAAQRRDAGDGAVAPPGEADDKAKHSPAPDPVVALQLDRNAKAAQVEVGSQGFKSERQRREEAEDKLAQARQRIAALEAEMAQKKEAVWSSLANERCLWEPPVTTRLVSSGARTLE
jgi:hypothetical protein